MRRALLLPAVLLLAGCVTTYGGGVQALRQGQNEAAAAAFEEVLAREPERLDALVGLGVARYRLGDLEEAMRILERAAAQNPRDATVRLYLGLVLLRKNEVGPAEVQLALYRDLAPGTRLASQADRALALLRAGPPSEEVRAFVATSLENAAETEHELAQTRAVLRQAELDRYFYRDPVYVIVPRRR